METPVAHIERYTVCKKTDIFFPEGMIGFSDYKNYSIIYDKSKEPFFWMQSEKEPKISFIIINPREFTNYDIILSEADKVALEINDVEECQIFSIVFVPQDADKISANLLSPLLINSKTNVGRQVVLQNQNYSVEHLILDEMSKVLEEKNVSSFAQAK